MNLLFAALAIFAVVTLPSLVYAGGPDDPEACYDYSQGQDKPFQRGNYDSCERFRGDYDDKNPYNEGFIDGCKSVQGNTEEVCERATD